MSALTIRRCSCADILENPAWPEVQKAYADEVRYPDLPVDLDYLMYLRLETVGVLKIVGGFDAEGRLVAVCNYLVFQLPHFAGKSPTRSTPTRTPLPLCSRSRPAMSSLTPHRRSTTLRSSRPAKISMRSPLRSSRPRTLRRKRASTMPRPPRLRPTRACGMPPRQRQRLKKPTAI